MARFRHVPRGEKLIRIQQRSYLHVHFMQHMGLDFSQAKLKLTLSTRRYFILSCFIPPTGRKGLVGGLHGLSVLLWTKEQCLL